MGPRRTAHDLERGDGVLFANGHGLVEPGGEDALADDVVEVEIGRFQRRVLARRRKRAGRLPVARVRVDGHELALGIAERGELSAEHAAGVDADGAVEPGCFGDRCVAVDDHGVASVVLRPRVAHG